MGVFPITYWFAVGLILAGAVLAVMRIKDGTGIPMLAVLGTVAVWYLGDAYYNDYAHYYQMLFRTEVLQSAWLQVCWFLIVFLLSVPPVHRWYNAKHLQYQSGAYQLAKFGIKQPGLQRQRYQCVAPDPQWKHGPHPRHEQTLYDRRTGAPDGPAQHVRAGWF